MGKTGAAKEVSSLGDGISVRLPSGQSIPVTMHKYDQMSKVYSLVSTETSSKVDLIRIKFTGKVLKGNQTASSLGIMEGMVLKAEIITEREIDITIKVEGKEPVTTKFTNTNTVQGVVNKISTLGLVDNTQTPTIFFGTKQLSDLSLVLYDAKVGNNSTLVVKPAEKRRAATKAPVTDATDSLTRKSGAANEVADPAEVIPAFSADGKTVEVVFSFDTTGSMYGVLAQVRASLRDLIDRLIKDIPNIRIGLMAHGDYCDQHTYVIRSHDLSGDAESLKDFAMTVPATGGGDAPEAYEWVLRKAQELDWSEDSAKALVVIGDCEPHPPSYTDQQLYWHTDLDILCGMGIKVYGVQAYNNDNATPFYRELADRTNGAYVKFSNFALIRDMFLAVCYNESSEDQLEEFMSELQQEGGMSNQKQQIFEQLKEQQQAVKEDRAADIIDLQIAFDPRQSRNYIAKPWFDRSLDEDSPSFSYNYDTNKWSPHSAPETKPSTSSFITSRDTETTSRSIIVLNKHGKKRRGLATLNCFK